MVMLSDKVKKKEVQNWMKGVLAITKTTEVLRSAIRNGFDQFISKLSDDEKKHLETFYQCLKNNGVEHFKTQTKRKKYWECPHHRCQTLMGRLLDNFENGSHKGLWEFNITQPAESEDYEESEDKSSKAIQTVELGGKWMLMKLFMFGEMKDVPRMSLEELDLSQTIKLMRSCKLFTDIDGSAPALEKALDKRNQLMHSKDNEINDEETISIFKELEDLVTVFADKTTSQEIDAVEDLHKLRDKKDLIECEDTTKYKELFREVLTIKEKALKLDISVNKNLHEESKTHSEELVQMLNVATAENKLIDVELTLDRSEQSNFEMQEKVREMTERARKHEDHIKKMKEEELQLNATIREQEDHIRKMESEKHQLSVTVQQHEEHIRRLEEEESHLDAEGQELETDIDSTTHSKLLRNVDKNDISQVCDVEVSQIPLIEPLSSFDTEQQFTGKEHVQTNTQTEGNVSLAKIKGLILKCIQAALALVKDVENRERERMRVELVMKLLFAADIDDDSFSFLYGVCCVVAKLLWEKSQHCFVQSDWMTELATSSDEISETGTFRRSSLKNLESHVSPVLAGVIAFLDTNKNIDICCDENPTWKTRLWKKILCTPNALDLKYSELWCHMQSCELREDLVLYTGVGEKVFQSKMPFSWLFISQINDVFRTTKETSYDDRDKLYKSMLSLLKEIPLCCLLKDIDDDKFVKEGLGDYVNDYVCSVYHNGSQEEHKVVCNALERRVMALYTESTEHTLLNAVLCVHLAYDDMVLGLSYFRLVNSIWSDCSNEILTLDVKDQNNSILKGNDITLAAAYFLCDHLSPVKLDNTTNRSQSKIEDSTIRTEWLEKVQQYRPVFEMTLHFLSQQAKSTNLFTPELKHIRCQWERIIVMKLFVEHICLTREEKTYVNYCMPLWNQLQKLGDDKNMKMIEPINRLEKFLQLINRKHLKDLLRDACECSQCERILDSVPVKLPCGDLICKGCFQGLRTRDRKCFTCKNIFPEHWEPTGENQNLKRKEIAILKGYQTKCNAFFMDIVSQLCFSENKAPSAEVVDKLLSFIIFDGPKESGAIQTKVMSIFDTGIDPTPVFRSFLLQLLWKSSMEDVKESLECYLNNANDIIKKHTDPTDVCSKSETLKTKQYVELCLMIIQCLEDIFRQEASSAEDEVEYAAEALRSVKNILTVNELSVNKLVCLAKTRMGLTVAAKYLNAVLEENHRIPPEVMALFEAAKHTCMEECEWPLIFAMKIISRCYGLDKYFKLCSSDDGMLNWVSVPEAKADDVSVVSDRYIICGEDYRRLRHAVSKIALGGEIADLDALLQELGTEDSRTAMYLDLAIYREITSSNIFPNDRRPVPETSIKLLEEYFLQRFGQNISGMLMKELHNTLMPEQLKVEERLDMSTQGLQCLLVHYMSVLSKLDGNLTLLQPFTSLLLNTGSYQKAFLPTMPQDDTDDVRALLLKDIDVKHKYSKLYKCPNGHIYLSENRDIIDDLPCIDCGAQIGVKEKEHVAFGTNKEDDITDETKSGHILGPPEKRPKNTMIERELTSSFSACVRLLLHMSLYLGSSNDLEAVCSIIHPTIQKEHVSTFLWEHIKVDVQILENALGKSMDDVLLLMHAVVDNLMTIHMKGDGIDAVEDIRLLISKAARKEWEIKFTKTYLQPTFNKVEEVLNLSNEKMAGDDRLVGNLLFCLMHETQNVPDTNENPQRLQDISRVWRYRAPISLEHLNKEFESLEIVDDDQYKILRLFLKEECHLRALRFVPSILRLQHALLKTYRRKLDRSEGNTITIQQVVHDKTAGPDTSSMIKDFTDAWELVRLSLKTYVCQIGICGMVVSEQLCNMSITDTTPVSVLLPATKGFGLCSLALLDFLLRKVQNGFLDNYLKETKREHGSFLSVKPKDLTSAHLISYDSQQDLHPLILTNCQYTFEMGKGTSVKYDFYGLERQIIDRFLLSKSRIDVGPVLQIDMMVYRTEVTNFAVFNKLAEKIPQSPSAAIKTQVSGEIKSYTDLCESLVNMDIAISFLKSTGGRPQQNLHAFMKDVLLMDTSIASRTAQQICEFQHCKKIWLYLSLLKSKMMADNNKAMSSIFESVGQAYHGNLQPEMNEILIPLLMDFTIEILGTFVEILHEYILLILAGEMNASEDDYIDTTDRLLRDYLYVYIESYFEEEDTDVVMSKVADLPEEILNKHSVPLWMMAYSILLEKQTDERRIEVMN